MDGELLSEGVLNYSVKPTLIVLWGDTGAVLSNVKTNQIRAVLPILAPNNLISFATTVLPEF